MTDIPAETLPQPPGGPDSPDRAGDEILLAFAGPAPQRRLTVLVRIFMAIPHLIVLYALNIAAEVVAFIGWFAALFTGRLPEGLASFLTGWLRWLARVYAYLSLLTDRYPPFELADSDYPVRVSAAPGRLNRLAVFFRLILVIPAGLLLALAGYGLTLAMIVIWVIVLITGTMPPSLHSAVAAVLRFYVRCYGYLYLLTGTYPGGLFGDRPEAAAAGPGSAEPSAAAGRGSAGPSAPAEPAEPSPAIPAEPATQAEPAAEQPPAWEQWAQPQPGRAQPAPAGAGPATGGGLAATAGPAGWRLVLTTPSKRLVGLFVGLGVLVIAGGITGGILGSSSTVSTATARAEIQSAHATLSGALATYQRKVAACQQDVNCVDRQTRQVAQAFGAFGQQLKNDGMPSGGAASVRDQLVQDAQRVQADLGQLSKATSPATYQRILAQTGLQTTITRFDADYKRLGQAISIS
ncbi:MAG: DUF4389 domain-containing protein [Nocardiopsaceae bacterium]|jgi:hypothetical protein|nr:DUF4389 domain-containing protein [Nocardiopsaceae bacterium]